MARHGFTETWQKIAGLEGESFVTVRGEPFTYRFSKTYLVVSPGRRSIPRTFFEKVFRRLAEGAAASAPSLEGQTFILAILTDPRLDG